MSDSWEPPSPDQLDPGIAERQLMLSQQGHPGRQLPLPPIPGGVRAGIPPGEFADPQGLYEHAPITGPFHYDTDSWEPPEQNASTDSWEPPAASDSWEPPGTGQSPTWGRVAKAGLYDIPSKLAHTLAPVWDAAAQTIAPSSDKNFDPDAAQKLAESAFPTGKGMDTSGSIPQPSPNLLTPQEQAAQTPGQHLASSGMDMVGNILPAALAGPAAPAVFAGMGAMQSGMGMLDQGTDLASAQKAAAIGGATGYASAYLPMKGATMMKSIGIGATVNPVAGVVDDMAVKYVMGEYGDAKAKQIAAQIDPFDLHKIGEAAILGGGIMGPAFHKIGEMQQSAADKAAADILKKIASDGTWMSDFMAKVSKTADDATTDRPHYVGDKTKTVQQNLEDLLHGDPSKDPAKLSDVVDLLASHPDIDPDTRSAFQTIQRRINNLGIADTTVFKSDNPKPDNPRSAGQYDAGQDAITMFNGKINPEHILHETVHAITSGAIDLWADHMTPESRASLTPDQQNLLGHIDGLNDIYRLAIERSPDKQLIRDNHQTESTGGKGDWTPETYGYKNLKEFAAEVMSRENFQRKLQEMRLTPEESRTLRVQTPRTIRTMWNAFTAKLHAFISGSDSDTLSRNPTMLQMALDHSTNLIDRVDSSTRLHKDVDPTRWNNSHFPEEADRQAKVMRDSFTDQNQKGFWYQVSNLLKNANSKAEFLTRLSTYDTHPAYRDFVKNYGDRLWDNGDHIIGTVGKDNAYDTMKPGERLIAGTDEYIPDFFARIKAELPPEAKGAIQEKDDIPAAGTAFLPSTQNLWLKGSTLGGQVMKLFINKAQIYHALKLKVRAEATAFFTEYEKLSKSTERAFMGFASHWDNVAKGGKTLVDMGLQWPTHDMLIKQGMTEEMAHAYDQVTKGLDYLWNIENQIAMKNGQPPIPQIPGYMPHVWSGDFKVSVLRTETYSGNHPQAGQSNSKVVHVEAFQTKWGALNYVRSLNKNFQDEIHGVPGSKNIGAENTKVTYSPQMDGKTGKPYEVSSLGEVSTSLMRSLQEHITAAHNLDNDPDVVAKLEQIEAARYQGFTKHMLERSDATGYIGENGPNKVGDTLNPIKAWLDARDNDKLVNLYDSYAKNVSEAYGNALFLAEVARPMLDHMPTKLEDGTYYGATLDNITNVRNYLKEFTSNFTGKNINHMKWADDEVRWEPTELFGLSPNLLRQTIGNLKNFMSVLYLRANPVFYFSNIIQPLHTMSILQMASTIHEIKGGVNAPSIMQTFAAFIKEIPSPSPELQAALNWAKNNHILDAQLEYALRRENIGNWKDMKSMIHTLTGGTINPAVERVGRQASFMLAYLHFKQMYPGDVMRARTAAQQAMEMTMVNYDKSSKPLMFTNFGAAGELASPFATFHNAYIGNQYMALKLAAMNPHRMSAWLPLAYSMAIFGTTAGVVGLPLLQDSNNIIEKINDLFGTNIPSVEKSLFRAGVPDSATFGLLNAGSRYIPGNSEGTNIAPSVSAVQMDQGLMTAMLPFVTALLNIGTVGARGAGNMLTDSIAPNSAEDYWKNANELLPGVAKLYLQKGFTKTGSTIIPKGNSLEGGVSQTPANEFSQTYLGRASSDVNKQKIIDRKVDEQSKFETTMIKKSVSLVADRVEDIWTSSQDKAEWGIRTAAKYGVSGDEFNKMVSDEVMARNTTSQRRDVDTITYSAIRKVHERMAENYPMRGSNGS